MSAYPSFPRLSRSPALKSKTSTLDPTLRSDLENGMEATRAKFTRRRRQWAVTIEFLTNDDWITLDYFVQNTAKYGANIFYFFDKRDPHNPVQYAVRFSKLPEYADAGWVEAEFRQNCTFELREV